MGFDVSTSLIVGVPLLNLGNLQEETKQRTSFDRLGKPNGTVIIKQVFFTALNDTRSLIASNKESIARRFVDNDLLVYFYDKLIEDDENDWFHQSDGDGGPGQVVIGLKPESIKGPELERYESFDVVHLQAIQDLLSKVSENLKTKFGYIGEIYIISQTNYSY